MTVTRYESLFQKYWLRSDSAKKTMEIKVKCLNSLAKLF